MKKILIFGFTATIGGVETFLMSYYRNINKKDYRFDFVTVYDNMVFADEIRKKGGKVYKVTNFMRNPFKYSKEIEDILKNENYDTVYVNMLSAANTIPLKLAKKYNVSNIVCHSHNSNTPNSFLKKVLHKINKKKILKYATCLVACSKKAGNWMFDDKKFIVLNNAIDCKKFSFNNDIRNEIRKKHKIENSKIVIGHIGRFSEQKNHPFILEIIRESKKLNKNVMFILIGDGEDKEKIVNEINEEKLNDYTLILNGLQDVYKYYNVFDTFILPSKFEGLPIVGIEAQANGLNCLFSSNITRELKMNDNVEFLEIDDPVKWVKKLDENLNRTEKINLKEHGYDILYNKDEFIKIINGEVYEEN